MITNEGEGIGNFVIVDAPGGRFEVWDESMFGNIGFTGISGSWASGIRPTSLEVDAASRTLFTGVRDASWGSRLRVDRLTFDASGRPIGTWQNVCPLRSASSFEVRGDTVYLLVDTSSSYRLEWRDAHDCTLRGSTTVALPAGRVRPASHGRSILAFDTQTSTLMVGVELQASSGRREVFVNRHWISADGSSTGDDTYFGNILPANAKLIDLDAQDGFLLVTSWQPDYDPTSTNYELDLYYNNSSRWRLEDTLVTNEVTNRESAVAIAARGFTGQPCGAGKSGSYLWIARGPGGTNRWTGFDHHLLERRAICAD
ncbi:MAG: hypothetical protein H6720_08835 [Sandaracinus sp.]|nr:hypothetical protein [Sandaracinus sp.]